MASQKTAKHPKSRKALQIRREQLRNNRLSSLHRSHIASRQHPLVDKLTWFQLRISPDQQSFDVQEISELVKEFISRNDEAISELEKDKQQTKRPVDKRTSLLLSLKKRELEEFRNGQFEMVDLMSPRSVADFRKWSGDYNSIPLLRIIRYTEKN